MSTEEIGALASRFGVEQSIAGWRVTADGEPYVVGSQWLPAESVLQEQLPDWVPFRHIHRLQAEIDRQVASSKSSCSRAAG